MIKYKFKQYGNELRFNYCPICGKEKENPDFTINIKTQKYFCHTTGQGGTLEQLEKDYNFDLNNIEEINPQELEEREPQPKKDFTEFFKNQIQNHLEQDWIDYLKGRGITNIDNINKLFRRGKNNSMMIPLIEETGKIIGIKYRTINKKLSSESGSSSNYFLNWHNVEGTNYIVIVEGEIDLLSALETGHKNIISLPFGANNIKCVKHQKEWLSKFEKIIIATDNDAPGRESKEKIIKELKNISHKLYEVDLGKYKDFNEVLQAEGKEKLNEIMESHKKIKKEKKEKSVFSVGNDCYYKLNNNGLNEKLTDFIIKGFYYSENYFKGVSVVEGRERNFVTKRTDLLTTKGILESIGSYFGSPQTILKFWDWLKEENNGKYIPEILHYGIINDKYYDEKSNVICYKQDLKIKDVSQIEPLTQEDLNWLKENLIYLRNDTCQSLLGICWALGRFHINESYPILEVSGTTSIGKTEYVEFISRILFGSKDNIKNLSTMTNHQIRSLCSCSNITPLVIDEVKITNKIIKSNIENLYSAIRSVYDNKEVNQGNTTNKLTEFKLCTPLIISGETEIMETSIKNRMVSTNLTKKNKSSDEVFYKLKETDLLEKLGKTALKNRLEKGAITIPRDELKNILNEVKDSRQLYNGMCILTGLRALNKIINISEDVNNHFIEFLNKKFGEDEYTVTENFIELLKLLKDIDDEELPTFYICDSTGHYARFTKLIIALKEIVNKTDSTLELLDIRTLKKQLVEEGFIINPRIFKRFVENASLKKTKPYWAVEFKRIKI